jgi:hypothetical protein
MNNIHRTCGTLGLLLGALILCVLSGTPATAQTITGTNQVALTDFDNTIPPWDYGYFYSWGWPDPPPPEPGTWTVDRYFVDPFTDPTNGPGAMFYQFDNSAYQELIATNIGAGYGTGFGAPLNWEHDPLVLNSTNLADYILSWDARVEGLADGKTSGNFQMQLQWYRSGTNFFENDADFQPGSNWSHFSVTLDQVGRGGVPVADWINTVANLLIEDLRFNVNLYMPNDQFGWDADNVVVIDNVQLEVIQYSGPPPPLVPVAIFDVNLDDKPGWGYFGGYNWSQNSSLPLFTYDAAAPGYGVGGSNAWILTMDNSALGPPNTPSWAGGGTGGGGPANLALFDTNSLKGYRVSFDSRVEGLAPDVVSTTCRLQLFLESPNGDTRLDFDAPAQSNWVTTVYTLDQGSFGMGSKAAFATNYNTFTGLRTQWQIENAQSTDWGYDSDNLLIIDNIKLERLYVATPPLTITVGANGASVSWGLPSTGSVKLQAASKPEGPYTEVVNAPNPYPIPPTGAPHFYRTLWVPPGP